MAHVISLQSKILSTEMTEPVEEPKTDLMSFCDKVMVFSDQTHRVMLEDPTQGWWWEGENRTKRVKKESLAALCLQNRSAGGKSQ